MVSNDKLGEAKDQHMKEKEGLLAKVNEKELQINNLKHQVNIQNSNLMEINSKYESVHKKEKYQDQIIRENELSIKQSEDLAIQVIRESIYCS